MYPVGYYGCFRQENTAMKKTTLCYIEKDGKYLMLFRNKKENDINAGKWIGTDCWRSDCG